MTGKIRTIVVGVASLHGKDPVLRPAVELAEALDATLWVVHAFVPEEPVVAVYAHPRYGINTWAMQERDLGAVLEARVTELGSGARVRCRAVAGSPARAIAKVAAEVGAELVVAGSTRRGPVARAVLGTTCGHVLREARVPVLMLRPAPELPSGRVLLTTDLSPMSGEVQERGVELARALGGGREPAFRSLHVSAGFVPPFLAMEGLPARVGSEESSRFLEERRAQPEGIEVEVRVGDPAREIVAEAGRWDAGLVVVGSHARKGARRLLLGSVAEAVVAGAPCSVLVIPAPAIELLDDGEVAAQLTA